MVDVSQWVSLRDRAVIVKKPFEPMATQLSNEIDPSDGRQVTRDIGKYSVPVETNHFY